MPKRLLIVDDETALLDLLKKYLERLGYEVDTSASAESALARFAASPGHYSLVFTDLTLPEMSGHEMLERMRALNPHLPAILASGYPHRPPLGTAFLLKPFPAKALAGAIEKALGGGAESGN
ncbi:MAG: response regulator [Bryobacteraceae bacterium]